MPQKDKNRFTSDEEGQGFCSQGKSVIFTNRSLHGTMYTAKLCESVVLGGVSAVLQLGQNEIKKFLIVLTKSLKHCTFLKCDKAEIFRGECLTLLQDTNWSKSQMLEWITLQYICGKSCQIDHVMRKHAEKGMIRPACTASKVCDTKWSVSCRPLSVIQHVESAAEAVSKERERAPLTVCSALQIGDFTHLVWCLLIFCIRLFFSCPTSRRSGEDGLTTRWAWKRTCFIFFRWLFWFSIFFGGGGIINTDCRLVI